MRIQLLSGRPRFIGRFIIVPRPVEYPIRTTRFGRPLQFGSELWDSHLRGHFELVQHMTLTGAILAAGLGTRLRPLTVQHPKPLVPVAGRPLLEYGADHLRRVGCTGIGVNAYHLASQVDAYASARDASFFVVKEESLRGTGGGIRGIAKQRPKDTLVVVNGDALFDFDLTDVIANHKRRGALGTLALRYVEPDAPFGRVGIDGGGRLHRVAEVSSPGADSLTLFYGAYTGVQIIEPELIERIPDGPCDILRTAYADVMTERGPVYGHFVPAESLWLDVGNIERYLHAHWAILDGRIAVNHLPCVDSHQRRISERATVCKGATIIGPAVIMPGAVIDAGATVGPYAFVDRGCHVKSSATLKHTVVWPNLVVTASHKETVVCNAD